jgi:hypothetical protein
MNRTSARRLLAAATFVLMVTPAFGQRDAGEMTPEERAMMEAYMSAGAPGEQHKMLAAQAGEYTTVARSWAEPGAPPVEEKGSATRTMILDGRVMIETYKGTMMGTPFTGQAMTGYDNVNGKFWATWNDSMSTGIMVMEGTCDAKMACAFTGTYNDPIAKGPVTSRMTVRWTSPTTEVMEMHGPGPDGKEVKMMELIYTKK